MTSDDLLPNHNHDTAKRHLVKSIPRVHPDESVAAALPGLAGNAFDYAGAIYVVDGEDRLLGLAPMSRLLAATPGQSVLEVARTDFPVVTLDTDQEEVASLAIRHGMTTMPVVDERRRLIGVVPPDAFFAILRQEHVEDLHRFVGITRQRDRARNAIEDPPLRRVLDRLPWLLVGLAGSMLATWIMAGFEDDLKAKMAIAFFIPGLVYLADAIGTQTEAIAVRGLSFSQEPIRVLLSGELRTGLLLGLILALPVFPFVWFVFGDGWLAASVSLALIFAGTAATTIGLGFPWILSRLGKDPAFGSGPLATIFQDVLSLIIYFTVITLLVA
jgi:magnesium transporter